MKVQSHTRLLLLAGLMLVLLPALGLAQGAEPPSPAATIDSALLDALVEPGSTADFFVFMAAQADLSASRQMADWSTRGRYVYDALRQTAAASQAPVVAYAQEQGLTHRSFLTNNAVYIEGGDRATVEALARLPGVDHIRLREVATIQPDLQAVQASPETFGWNLDTLDPTNSLYGMQAAQVWGQYGVTGQGIVVANIDTGVYYQHIALDRQYRGNTTGVVGGPYSHNYNWYQPNLTPCGNSTYPCDADDHGTATMGIMVAETPDLVEQLGVAPDARWIACQGCDDPPYCTEEALTACADWMLAPCAIGDDPGDPTCDPDKRPHIVNNSWGGSGCDTWYLPYVQAWVAAGIFPAFAAGNSGGCGTVASPGDLPGSFGTAAHFTDGQNAYAGGPSCFYPTPTCDPAAHDIDPHVNAPTGGKAPINGQGQYYAISGTSGASPHTAGTVALLWAANPGLIGQIDATFTILEQSANRDLPAPNCGKPACAGANSYPNYDFGWGYLDALAAVEMAGAGATGTLQGTVSEGGLIEAPGDPLPGVTITAQRLDSIYPLRVETGAGGTYSLTLTAGTYTVTADGPQHGPETVTGTVIVTDTVTPLDFQLLPKGLLYGYITDAETGTPLAASVTAGGAGAADTDPATGYYSLYLGQGSHDLVIQASNYASQTTTIEVLSGQQMPLDFQLIASLALAPRPIEATLELSGSLNLTTVITNRTAAAYNYQLTAESAQAGDEGPILLVHDENLDENPDAFAIAFDNLGYDYLLIDAAGFYGTAIPDLLNYAAVVYTGVPDAGARQNHIIAYLEAGGRFLLADGSFTLYHGDSRLHEVYLQAVYDGLDEWAGPQLGLDIMAGLMPDISSAIVVYDSYAGPEGVGIFQAPGSNLTGIRTERRGYRAIYLSFDLNRIGAREPGDPGETDVVYRAMLWLLGYSVEVPWYTTDVSTGSVPAHSSGTFLSQFSATPAAGIDQPGKFYANLYVEPSTLGEIYPRLDVPVHLTVVPGATMGKVSGTLISDRPGGPVATEVQIEGAGGGSWTTRSDWWTGAYDYWLEAGAYTLTVAAEGYYTETAQVTLTAGLTATHDFSLTLAAPEIALETLALEDAVSFGSATTRTLQVANAGPEPLTFEVQERDRGLTPLAVTLLEATPQDVNGARILFDEYHGANSTFYGELFADLQALGATVDVWSAGRLTETVLAGYDIVVIGDFLDRNFHYSELDAIEAFVQQGGGLFVTYECCDDTTAPVLTRLFGVDYIGRGGTAGITPNVYPHPTTQGVGSVYIPSPQYVMTASVTGTAEIVLYDVGGTPAAAVNEVGYGKVFVMPDQEFWDGVYGQADNTQFGRNVFGWLYGGAVWLASDVVSATVAPGEALTLVVTLDGGAVDEPAVYHGDLVLPSNDPLVPAVGVVVTLTVGPTADLGRLWGTITSDRPGGALPADLAIKDGGGLTMTVYSLPSTGAYQRWLHAGTYTVTASAAGYVTQTAAVQVPAAGSSQLDFELRLDAPGAATLPAAVEETVTWGLTATRRLTVSNVGLHDLNYFLLEEDLGWAPLAQGPLAFIFDFENDTFASFAVDTPGDWTVIATWTYQYFDGGDFRLNDFGQLYVIHGDYLYTLDTTTGDDDYVAFIGMDYPHRAEGMTIAADGTLYAVTDYWYGFPGETHESYLWTIDPVHGTPTQIGQVTNAEYLADVAINLNGEMYAVDAEQDVLIQIDPDTGVGTVIGSLGFDLWTGSLEFDDDTGTLYLASWDYLSGQGHFWTVDTATGTASLIGNFPPGRAVSFLAIAADGLVDIPWLTETPTAGTVPADGGQGIDLTFDAGVTGGPGTYWGQLHLQSNDPLLADLTVPVTMTVIASGDLGELAGTVTSLGYCDANPQPLEAQIVLEAGDGTTWATTSDPADGSYSRWVPAGTYTVTAGAAEHLTTTMAVLIEAATTTAQDLDLRLFEPCLGLAPTTFSLTLSMGTLWTESLTLTNDGARDLSWLMKETTDTLAQPALPPIPRFEGEWPAEPAPASMEPAPWSPALPSSPEAPEALPELLGAPAYGLDTSTFNLVHIPDITTPGTWTVVNNTATFYSGGDFWHGDFSKLYALDFYTNEFITLDTTTGARTVIGTAHTLPGHHWTGLTAATDGTIYGVSAECNVSSALYTIDRLTGEATLVGTTTAAPCLIDVAINAQGEMYAVDISSDALFQIDPTTAAATTIGLLGIDANHAQSLDFEEESGTLYWAAVDNVSGSLRRIDTTTGASLHVGYFPNYTGVDCLALATGGGDPFWGDVPWVREVPDSGLTPAGDATQVDVIFDTTVLTVGQCYEAGLGLVHDDPQYGQPAMTPLTLCVEKPWPVFYLTKTVAAGESMPGETATYTLVFGNDGSLETGIVISDVLPAGVEYAWSEPEGAYDPGAHTLSWGGLVLDAGARVTATVVVTVESGMEPGTWLTNTSYLLWRDQMLSNWASLQVGGKHYVYLPLVVKNHTGE